MLGNPWQTTQDYLKSTLSWLIIAIFSGFTSQYSRSGNVLWRQKQSWEIFYPITKGRRERLKVKSFYFENKSFIVRLCIYFFNIYLFFSYSESENSSNQRPPCHWGFFSTVLSAVYFCVYSFKIQFYTFIDFPYMDNMHSCRHFR